MRHTLMRTDLHDGREREAGSVSGPLGVMLTTGAAFILALVVAGMIVLLGGCIPQRAHETVVHLQSSIAMEQSASAPAAGVSSASLTRHQNATRADIDALEILLR